MSTVLGSCIAACIRDPERGLGGMNHFLLPDGDGNGDSEEAKRYGVNAMEILINSLLRAGARRDRLEAKLFGGASMFDRLRNIGAENAAFAKRFLQAEGIAVIGGDTGGTSARRRCSRPRSCSSVVARRSRSSTEAITGRAASSADTSAAHSAAAIRTSGAKQGRTRRPHARHTNGNFVCAQNPSGT
jgi:chemotaxis receptor (MCP) glutamine deamidase CheD